MKKLILFLHILTFTFMQIAPAYSSDGVRENQALSKVTEFAHLTQNFTLDAPVQQTEAAVKITTEVRAPRNYRLPNMFAVDALFKYWLRNQDGQRGEVEGFVGRFGVTLGPDFKNQIYKIEQEYKSKVEIILTLTSTIKDAHTLKAQLEKEGRKMVIVEVPDWFQKRLLEQASAASQGKFKEMLWLGKDILRNPGMAAKNAFEIIKNQYEKPSRSDIRIAAITTTLVGGAGIAGTAMSVGLDPVTLVTLLSVKMALGGVTVFNKFIGNLNKSDIFNEFTQLTGLRRMFSETVYSLSTGVVESGSVNINPLEVTSKFAESAASVEKDEKIKSEKANKRVLILTLALGATIAFAGNMGASNWSVEMGSVQIPIFQVGVIGISTLMFFAYRHIKKVERIAEERYARLVELQEKFRIRPMRAATCQSLFR